MTDNLEQRAREAFEALDATLKLEAIGRGKSVARTATRRFAEMLLPLLNPIESVLKGQPASSGWEGIERHTGHCSPVLVCRETPTETFRATSAFMDVTGVWRVFQSKGGRCPLPFVPTHWQPLPSPPEPAAPELGG